MTTSLSDSHSNNIVELCDWKKNQFRKKQEDSLSEYLSILTFHELILESNELITKIKSAPFDEDLVIKAKLILKEFKLRLKDKAPEMYASLEEHLDF